jgi:hypothetical protein
LAVALAHDVAGRRFLDRPGRREAARGLHAILPPRLPPDRRAGAIIGRHAK